MKLTLAEAETGEWYIIPRENLGEWYDEWTDFDGVLPEWAEYCESPGAVSFDEYQVTYRRKR